MQKLRWCASALLTAEANFRRVKDCNHVPMPECA